MISIKGRLWHLEITLFYSYIPTFTTLPFEDGSRKRSEHCVNRAVENGVLLSKKEKKLSSTGCMSGWKKKKKAAGKKE